MSAPAPTTTEPHASEQTFGIAGIAPMDCPSAMTRFFMGIVAWAESLNLKYAKLGNPPVMTMRPSHGPPRSRRNIPRSAPSWKSVLLRQSELPTFQDISTDVKTISTDSRWKTFFLVGFGVKSEQNIKACPNTWARCRKFRA